MRIAVGIATAGRPDLLAVLLDELTRQSRVPDRVLVCAPSESDFGTLLRQIEVEAVIAERGLTRQRNAILDRCQECDVVVFFDDDFLPHSGYLTEIETIFTMNPDVVMVTGSLVADGIVGPGLTIDEARVYLSAASCAMRTRDSTKAIVTIEDAYGCNMAVRISAAEVMRCRFDERLPLYAWLEDVDFSRRLGRQGRIVRSLAAIGVHLGAKQGRQSGFRLGYSQIANPIYLSSKGTYPWGRAARLMCRNILANFLRSLRPEAYVDRRGRAAGNMRAIRDLIAGRLTPERILEL